MGRFVKRAVAAVVNQNRCDGRACGVRGTFEKRMQNFDTETRKYRQLGTPTHCQEGDIKMAVSEVVCGSVERMNLVYGCDKPQP
jgi:hypothetical protein